MDIGYVSAPAIESVSYLGLFSTDVSIETDIIYWSNSNGPFVSCIQLYHSICYMINDPYKTFTQYSRTKMYALE